MIAAGYGRTPADIGRYTWRQLQLFYAVRQAAIRRARRARLTDLNVAAAGGKALRDLAQALGD